MKYSIFYSKIWELYKSPVQQSPMESVAIERLKLWQEEFNGEIGKIIHLLEVK
ncbi:MAG: hypothetical protein KAQ79_18355 [Cyclobacteriaceae bacterium]|nr:hypothetical protein [Cyclobacteriaceae bacterium]